MILGNFNIYLLFQISLIEKLENCYWNNFAPRFNFNLLCKKRLLSSEA